MFLDQLISVTLLQFHQITPQTSIFWSIRQPCSDNLPTTPKKPTPTLIIQNLSPLPLTSPPPPSSHQLLTSSLTPTILAVGVVVAVAVAVADATPLALTPVAAPTHSAATAFSGSKTPLITTPCTSSLSAQRHCLAPGPRAAVIRCSRPDKPDESWL